MARISRSWRKVEVGVGGRVSPKGVKRTAATTSGGDDHEQSNLCAGSGGFPVSSLGPRALFALLAV